LNFLASGNCRWQEKAEARLGFDVELAVAPGLGKNQNEADSIPRPTFGRKAFVRGMSAFVCG
jgi:hypothetical protein